MFAGMSLRAEKSASEKIFYGSGRRGRNFYPQALTASRENAPRYGEAASEATVGRYISSDPIGIYGGLNTFNYANVNPVMNIDPTGNAVALVMEGCVLVITGIIVADIIQKQIEQCHKDPNSACNKSSPRTGGDAPPAPPPAIPKKSDEGKSCQAHYVSCLDTSLDDLPGSAPNSGRCDLCRQACVREGEWPSSTLSGSGLARCDYWNFSSPK